MKKILISAVLLLIFSISFAQIPGNIGYDNNYSSIKAFGFKGGVNFSNVHGKDVEDSKMKFGFIGGVFYDFPVNEQISIQPEILFSMKGWRFEDNDYDYKYWGKLNYIEIPILVKYKLNNLNKINPILYFGPCFGFNISSTYKVSYDGDTDTGTIEYMNVFEFGIVPGIMLDLNNNFTIDFRYSIGLTDIDHIEEEYSMDFDPVKNSVISLMIGVKLQ